MKNYPLLSPSVTLPHTEKHTTHLIIPAMLEQENFFISGLRPILRHAAIPFMPESGAQRYLIKGHRKEGFKYLLEQQLSDYFGCDPARQTVLAVSTGTNALRLAIRALVPLRPTTKQEIILPALTVSSTADAVLMEGYTPVIIDVDPHTWQLDPEQLEDAITENTAAVISVDWLGSAVGFEAIKQICHKHQLPWISDSAQSFGITYNEQKPIHYADATTFSTGYPKVFHTLGEGGILVIGNDALATLEQDPTRSLFHESMPEINAWFGLQLLGQMPQLLKERKKAAHYCREALQHITGLTFPKLRDEAASNAYQLTFHLDPKQTGFSAEECRTYLAEQNIRSSIDKMTSLAQMPHLQKFIRCHGRLTTSRYLSENNLTLPLSPQLSETNCKTICQVIADLYLERKNVHRTLLPAEPEKSAKETSQADILLRNFSRYCILNEEPLTYHDLKGNRHTAQRIIIPAEELWQSRIPVAWLLHELQQLPALHRGQILVPPFILQEIFASGDLLIDTENYDPGRLIGFSESGSSADVWLGLDDSRQLIVHKHSHREGIDGNGTPWLRRQLAYSQSSEMTKYADIFVAPLSFSEQGSEIIVRLPYIDGISWVEHLKRGETREFGLGMLEKVLHQLSTRVWPEGLIRNPGNYLQHAHLERMKRRLEIAAGMHPELNNLLSQPTVKLNGKTLLNFPELYEKLLQHPLLATLDPPCLSLLHGDLNLFNILCTPSGNAPGFKLIDPRGTPLWVENLDMEEVERGDFVYDLGKIKFSLSGFIAVRDRLFELVPEEPGAYTFHFHQHHRFIQTLEECDHVFTEFCENSGFLENILGIYGEAKGSGWKMRLELAEAANFIADAACALGRDCKHEVLPLFLIGLEKLNTFVARYLCESAPLSSAAPSVTSAAPSYGLQRLTRYNPSEIDSHPWQTLDIALNEAAINDVMLSLNAYRGKWFPEHTAIYLAHLPYTPHDIRFPAIVLHPFTEPESEWQVLGQTHRQTEAFLKFHRENNLQKTPEFSITLDLTQLSADTLFCRGKSTLRMPSPACADPFELMLKQACTFSFPKAGRWYIPGYTLHIPFQQPSYTGKNPAFPIRPGNTEGGLPCFIPKHLCQLISYEALRLSSIRLSLYQALALPLEYGIEQAIRLLARQNGIAEGYRLLPFWEKIAASCEQIEVGERHTYDLLATLNTGRNYLHWIQEAQANPDMKLLLYFKS